MTLKANVTALKTDMKTIKDQNKATDKKLDSIKILKANVAPIKDQNKATIILSVFLSVALC